MAAGLSFVGVASVAVGLMLSATAATRSQLRERIPLGSVLEAAGEQRCAATREGGHGPERACSSREGLAATG